MGEADKATENGSSGLQPIRGGEGPHHRSGAMALHKVFRSCSLLVPVQSSYAYACIVNDVVGAEHRHDTVTKDSADFEAGKLQDMPGTQTLRCCHA